MSIHLPSNYYLAVDFLMKKVKKLEPDIKRWLKLMGEKRYDEAEDLNIKKIWPVLGKGALPYAPSKKEISNPSKFLKIVSCSVQVRNDQPKFCVKEGYPRAKGCYNPYAVCRGSVKIGSKQPHKRKPSAFNRCVGKTLKAATYKNKTQWKNEFKKAVKKCKK